ncbi:hypothetical protein Y032_0037g3488 [Ancylostoma ceylanicum]|uniref:Uncharacterized protein n=1 Tax=Ancylostoma ceylanicum TaxID=53326 RepID=A0A016UJ21_9BILA|nr:hypothetical protein Y032_0037g3488 [Ancylostoma ceylanicum]
MEGGNAPGLFEKRSSLGYLIGSAPGLFEKRSSVGCLIGSEDPIGFIQGLSALFCKTNMPNISLYSNVTLN